MLQYSYMTKHVRIPAPVPKILPSIIRSTGARMLLLAAGCAALLVLGGGGYLLSHSDIPFVPHKPAVQAAPADSKVLGTATTKSGTQTSANSAPASTTATNTSQPAPNPQLSAQNTAAAATVCVGSCTGHQATVAPSFDIIVDTSKITQSDNGLIINVPFSIVRYGGLTAPITPGSPSIMLEGVLTGLIFSQTKMIDSNHGILVLSSATKLVSQVIGVHFSASAGNILASTSFTYHL